MKFIIDANRYLCHSAVSNAIAEGKLITTRKAFRKVVSDHLRDYGYSCTYDDALRLTDKNRSDVNAIMVQYFSE